MSYINPYTGKKYKTLNWDESEKPKKGDDYPDWISETKFKNILKKFRR